MSDDEQDEQGEETEEDRQALTAEIRKILEDATDPVKAMAHRFEYHLFHAGTSHRIGRAAHQDIMDLIGMWCIENRLGIIKQAKAPVHVFMDGVLWMTLGFRSFEPGLMTFTETSVMFGLIQDAIVEDEPREFAWREE